jgi:hypothetical protein
MIGSREVALVNAPSVQRTRHYEGTPPFEGEPNRRTLMARANIVVLRHQPDGFFLVRYTRTGQLVGDTWHASREDALMQLDYEYPEALSALRDATDGPSDDAELARLLCANASDA